MEGAKVDGATGGLGGYCLTVRNFLQSIIGECHSECVM